MSTTKLSSLTLLLCIFIQGSTFAATAICEDRSGGLRAQLIELYTSEGCSSCPPADRWLSTLVPKVVKAEEVVPLAFHVDYWDRLGWRDRFADPSYAARQYASAKVSGSGFVFTPQVVLAGRNFAAWSSIGSVQKVVRDASAVAPDASFVLRQHLVTSGRIEFEVQAQLRQGVSLNNVRVHAALFQNGLVTDVAKGENSGNQLHHDYVVRKLLTSKAIDHSGKIRFQERFTLPDDAQMRMMGMAVFAQDAETGVVLQAMSAPLCTSVR